MGISIQYDIHPSAGQQLTTLVYRSQWHLPLKMRLSDSSILCVSKFYMAYLTIEGGHFVPFSGIFAQKWRFKE